MKYKKILIISLVFVFVALYTITRAAEKWKDITIDNGLPNKYIKSMKTEIDSAGSELAANPAVNAPAAELKTDLGSLSVYHKTEYLMEYDGDSIVVSTWEDQQNPFKLQ